mmetsp:Transcript_40592/g.115694  ORF Transcript_40592/g.115694 Transcript_40592/m.115694 type:complete len:246 (-) Transcript_40592:575-1312(-)
MSGVSNVRPALGALRPHRRHALVAPLTQTVTTRMQNDAHLSAATLDALQLGAGRLPVALQLRDLLLLSLNQVEKTFVLGLLARHTRLGFRQCLLEALNMVTQSSVFFGVAVAIEKDGSTTTTRTRPMMVWRCNRSNLRPLGRWHDWLRRRGLGPARLRLPVERVSLSPILTLPPPLLLGRQLLYEDVVLLHTLVHHHRPCPCCYCCGGGCGEGHIVSGCGWFGWWHNRHRCAQPLLQRQIVPPAS